jgi:hypothetical protein
MAEWSKIHAEDVRCGNVITFAGDIHEITSRIMIRGVMHFETDKGNIKIFKNAVVEVFR